MEWPAGRVLLQWALDEAGLGDGGDGVILELGAGIGITAIGLAAAVQRSGHVASQIVATDVCDQTLALLRANADAHGLTEDVLKVAHWDAARGEESLETLPCQLDAISHVVGADVVYHGFGEHNASDNAELAAAGADAPPVGFPQTLALLLHQRPSLKVSLLTVDRFSGGAIAAVAASAGVHQPSTAVDPAIVRFIRRCEELGLAVEQTPLPPAVLAEVASSQSMLARTVWWLCGHYDGMSVLSVSPVPPEQRKYEHVPDGVHEGVGCDRTGANPIVGSRYTLEGQDYDLCEAEYAKLNPEEQRRFTKLAPTAFYRRVGPTAPAPVPVRHELPPARAKETGGSTSRPR